MDSVEGAGMKELASFHPMLDQGPVSSSSETPAAELERTVSAL